MWLKLQNAWINVRSSLWFLPTVLIIAGIVLAFVLPQIDITLDERGKALLPGQIAGSVDAARTLLSVIAGSLITVVSIAYSISIVAMQQVAVQFSPRVLRNFTSDRGNQMVLGIYLATFAYTLLVLRQIRSSTEEVETTFLPTLAVAFTLVLTLLCLAMLVYFIHHVSQSLQVSVIMDRVRREFIDEINTVYPPTRDLIVDPPHCSVLAETLPRHEGPGYIRSKRTGFVRRINDRALLSMLPRQLDWLVIQPQVGAYVPYGGILLEVSNDQACNRRLRDQLQDIFILDNARTITQDPLFGVRQLVDIALKALSPAINDVTTAEYVLANLGDMLGRLALRDFPPTERVARNGHTRCFFNHPLWDEFVDTAFSQIRRQAAGDVHVTSALLHVLYDVALRVPPGRREEPIRHQIDEIRRAVTAQSFSEHDKAMLLDQAAAVDEILQSNILLHMS